VAVLLAAGDAFVVVDLAAASLRLLIAHALVRRWGRGVFARLPAWP
jgi:hypothetical protein